MVEGIGTPSPITGIEIPSEPPNVLYNVFDDVPAQEPDIEGISTLDTNPNTQRFPVDASGDADHPSPEPQASEDGGTSTVPSIPPGVFNLDSWV